ncbi:hypothetical protein [Novibacillus thermophilus]|uniref:TraC-like domain-containing protein n=1 Tax=Novibacillus thermophilus TaxID=1471761 RepID=A0A1U9K6J5_9BACL|nr:hypothetical protein [Novibacillus thermophilus]AQS55651.1 hypothetical protein B0W44_07495 [Novibacillus thermophilus]AQS56995.1 hypothetical protein B0W44_15815 [Novibacillus thermophilus]
MTLSWSDLLLVVLGIAAFFLFRSSKKLKAPKENTSDLIQVERIDSDGLVETEDGWYVMYFRVTPVALPLKSPQEQSMIWNSFRDIVNTLSHRMTCRAESHHYDIQDYFQEYKAQAIQTEDADFIRYADELRDYFISLMEQQSVRDLQYILRLEINREDLSDFGFTFGNPTVEELLKKTKKQDTVSDEEMRDLARQELTNTYRVVRNYFNRVGVNIKQMEKKDVLDYLYRSSNRDTSPLLTWEEMEDHGVFRESEKVSVGKLRFEGGH